MGETELNWKSDKRLSHWLTGRKEGTRKTYLRAWELYSGFRGLDAEELVQEKWRDMQKDPYDQGAVETEIKRFYKHLTEECEVRGGKVGYSPRTALTYVAAIADFYRRHNMPLSMKLTQEFQEGTLGRPVNETEKMSAEQVERLAYYAPTLRDKAFIWCLFQSGSDVSTFCSLNWSHVMKEIADPPMGAVKLKGLRRKKEPGQNYITFIYVTAVKHLKAYLTERWGRDYMDKLEYDTPLFTGEGRWKEERVKTRMIQDMLRDIAPKVDFVPRGQIQAADLNPLRPHALRASFSDRMAKAGASKLLVDYLMGHKMRYGPAYFGGEEGLREAYVKYAKEVLEPRRLKSTEELEKELRARIQEMEDQLVERAEVVTQLVRESREREKKVQALEQQLEERDQKYKAVEEKLNALVRKLQPLLKE